MAAAMTLIADGGRERRSKQNFFRRLDLLEGLPDGTADELARIAELRRMPRGSSLWEAGDQADAVYFVRSGVVKLTGQVAADRPITVGFHGRQEFLGFEGGPAEVERTDSARWFEDGAVYVVERSTFDRFLRGQPVVTAKLLDALAATCRQLRVRLAMLNFRSAKAKLGRILLELSRSFGVRDSRGTIVDLRLTHRELAALIGATRETVSVAIVEMRKEGLIQTEHRRVVLLDLEALEDLDG